MSNKLRDLDGVSRGKDIFNVDPRVLVLDYEWNDRESEAYSDADFLALKEYIRENGVPGMIIVYRKGDKLVVTDGYRRLTATNELIAEGVDIQSVIVMTETSKNEADFVLTKVITQEGKKRSQLELGRIYKQWLAYGGSIADLAKKLGKQTGQITGAISLAETSPEIHQMISSGVVAPTTAIQVINQTDTSSEAVEILSEAVEVAQSKGKGKATQADVETVQESKGKTPRKPNLKNAVSNALASARRVDEEGQTVWVLSDEVYESLLALVEP